MQPSLLVRNYSKFIVLFQQSKNFFPKAKNNNDIKIVVNRVRFWQLEDNLDGPLGWLLAATGIIDKVIISLFGVPREPNTKKKQ